MKYMFALCGALAIAAFTSASVHYGGTERGAFVRYGRYVASAWDATCRELQLPSPLLSPSEALAAPCAIDNYARKHLPSEGK